MVAPMYAPQGVEMEDMSRQGLNVRSWGNIRLLIKTRNLHFNF